MTGTGTTARKPTLKRGGARNRRDRTSLHLAEHDCRKVIASAEAAWAAGMPYNRWITILWERGGIDPRDNAKATGAFIGFAREWLRARGHRLAWCWVQEHGERNGAHCHILLHVPPELDPLFRKMPLRWVKRILGGQYVKRALLAKRLSLASCARADNAIGIPEAYYVQLMGKVHYMLKCAPAVLELDLGLHRFSHAEWGQSCLIYGKRAGVWQQRRTVRRNGKSSKT
jgi:hypothetical protein